MGYGVFAPLFYTSVLSYVLHIISNITIVCGNIHCTRIESFDLVILERILLVYFISIILQFADFDELCS